MFLELTKLWLFQRSKLKLLRGFAYLTRANMKASGGDWTDQTIPPTTNSQSPFNCEFSNVLKKLKMENMSSNDWRNIMVVIPPMTQLQACLEE